MNVVAIAAYSTLTAYLGYRAGIRQYDLTKASIAVLDDIPVGVAFLDDLFRFELVNREFARISGIPRRDLIGRDVSTAVWPEDRETLDREHERRLAGESSTYELRIQKPDGSAAETIVSAIPFMNGGRFDGVLAVVNDVTELVRIREEVKRFRNVSGFLMDAVTHELSNAMQAVLSRSEVAIRLTAGKDDRLATLAAATADAAGRSSRLIKEIKMIALAERKQWPTKPTRIVRVVEEALDQIGQPARIYVRAEVPANLANVAVNINDMAVLAVAKVLEEAGSGTSPEEPRVDLLVSSRSSREGGGIITINIRGSRRALALGDAQALTQAPSRFTTGGIAWRDGVRLALASAIAEAQGWRLAAVPEASGIGTIFEFQIPLAGVRGLDGGSSPADGSHEAGGP